MSCNSTSSELSNLQPDTPTSLTAIDVFSKYLFAVPLRRITSKAVKDALTQIFLQHAYIPAQIITDQGKQFVSSLTHEVMTLFDIKLTHASVKHPQTLGLLERAHARIKNTLKAMEGKGHAGWHKAVDSAVFAHNTRIHPGTKTTPTEMFRGVPPTKALDMRFGVNNFADRDYEHEPTQELRDRLMALWQNQHDHLVKSYIKNKEYFDRYAQANTLPLHSYCLILNPELDTQKQTLNKMDCKWIGFFRIEKCMSHQNYLVRKIGTNHTQCVHRIRLKPIGKLPHDLTDIEHVDKTKFVQDPEFSEQYLEPTLFDKFREQVLWEEGPTELDPEYQEDLQYEHQEATQPTQPTNNPGNQQGGGYLGGETTKGETTLGEASKGEPTPARPKKSISPRPRDKLGDRKASQPACPSDSTTVTYTK